MQTGTVSRLRFCGEILRTQNLLRVEHCAFWEVHTFVPNAMCTEASYSYTCLATKGTCKAAFSWKFLSAKCMEVPESCSAGVDEIRETASTIKTEVRAELKGRTK